MFKYCSLLQKTCKTPIHNYLRLSDSLDETLQLVRSMDQAKEYKRERDDIDVMVAKLGQTKAEKLLLQINDEILTLNCPVCKKPFSDFDACVVLKCSLCTYKFCGWCFEYFPHDVNGHPHVGECARNPHPGSVFGTFEDWTTATVVYRKRLLQKFLSELSLGLNFEIMADVKRLSDVAFA